MRAIILFSVLIGLLFQSTLWAKPTKALQQAARHATAKKVGKTKTVIKQSQLCSKVTGKRKGLLSKNCKRVKFKVVTEGHVLAGSVTKGVYQLPQGWVSIKSAHTGESICVNIFTGTKCDPHLPVSRLLRSTPPENLSDLPSQHEVSNPAQSSLTTAESKQNSDAVLENSNPSAEILTSKEVALEPGPMKEQDAAPQTIENQESAASQAKLAEQSDSDPMGPKISTLDTNLASLEKNTGELQPEDEDGNPTIAVTEGESNASIGESEGEGPSNSKITGIVTDPYLQDTFIDPDIHIHPDAQAAIDWLFRDRRTGHKKNVHPRLIVKLSSLYEHFKKQILLVSGYRNQKHTTSRHYGARASDIQIPGIDIEAIREFAQAGNRQAIGIGLYPKGGFIHLDARDAPSYLWVQHIVPIRRGKQGRRELGHNKHSSHSKAIASKSTSSSKRHS